MIQEARERQIQVIDPTKRFCDECGWRGHQADILTAANPFDSEDVVVGCPQCKCVNTIKTCCDEPGCWEPDDCGTPTAEGYRRTCGEHMRGLL